MLSGSIVKVVQSAAINTNGINKMTDVGVTFLSTKLPCGSAFGIYMLVMHVLTENIDDRFVLRIVGDIRHTVHGLGK
jgi:hypothetical protein